MVRSEVPANFAVSLSRDKPQMVLSPSSGHGPEPPSTPRQPQRDSMRTAPDPRDQGSRWAMPLLRRGPAGPSSPPVPPDPTPRGSPRRDTLAEVERSARDSLDALARIEPTGKLTARPGPEGTTRRGGFTCILVCGRDRIHSCGWLEQCGRWASSRALDCSIGGARPQRGFPVELCSS